MEDRTKRGVLKAALSAALLGQLVSAQSADQTKQAGSAAPPASPKGKNPRPKQVYKANPRSLNITSVMAELEKLRKKNASRPGRAARAASDHVDQAIAKLAAEMRSAKRELPPPALRAGFAFQSTGQQFSPIRFDLLASQSTALVQRCLQTRQEWEQLYQTTADFYYDLETFEKLDAIHRLEDAAGYYELDEQQSAADMAVADVLKSANEFAASVLGLTQTDLEQRFNEYWAWAQLVGWLSHISGYQKGAAANTVVWDNVEKTVIEYSHEAATAQAELGLRSAINQLESDRAVKKGQADAIDTKQPSLAARLSWDRKNKNFRKLRTEVLRDLYKRKKNLAGEASGPLNYRDRLDRLGSGYNKDLSAALERLPQIAQGFRELAGYDAPLPDSCTSALSKQQTQPSEHVLDDADAWLRAAGNWYTKFLETEQLGTFVVSVRHMVSESDWTAFLNGSDVTIELAEGMLPNQRHVRLRAVSLYTEDSRGGWFAARVTCPIESFYLHLDGSKHTLRQAQIPALRAGRIESLTSVRPPERLGANAAYNASPFGKWRISLSETSIPAGRRASISDLLIEIIYAYQEAK